jgi:hypothetical protein
MGGLGKFHHGVDITMVAVCPAQLYGEDKTQDPEITPSTQVIGASSVL